MGYKNDDPCLQKAFDDERLFVLMTRDTTAPEVVIEWIKQNIRTQPKEKLIEALNCALEMVERQEEFYYRKQGYYPVGGHDHIPMSSVISIVLENGEVLNKVDFGGHWLLGSKYYKILSSPPSNDNDDLPF